MFSLDDCRGLQSLALTCKTWHCFFCLLLLPPVRCSLNFPQSPRRGCKLCFFPPVITRCNPSANRPHQFSCLFGTSWLDLNSGPCPQDLKSSLKPEVRRLRAVVDASLGALGCEGSSQASELFPQPAAKDSLASSYLGSGTAAILSQKRLICGGSLSTLRVH